MLIIRRPLFAAVALSLSLFGCNNDDKKIKNPVKEEPNSPPLVKDFKGDWVTPGEGIALRIDDEIVLAYNYTRQTCSLLLDLGTPEEADALLTDIQSSDSQELTFVFLGETEENRTSMTREDLPNVCDNVLDPDVFDPEFIFSHLWHSFNDYYAFFALRDVDWQAQWNTFSPQVSSATTPDELYALLQTMLSPLDDGHVGVFSIIDDKEVIISPGKLPRWEKNYASFLDEIDKDDGNNPNTIIIKEFNDNLEKYYGSDGYSFSQWNASSPGVPLLYWGLLKGNIAYLQINGMEFEDDVPVVEQIKLIKEKMPLILKEFESTDGMVIDVRFNPGGYDQFSLEIANFFTDKKRLAYSKSNYNIGNPTPRIEGYVEPSNIANYLKPIALITSDNTASAAEIFALAMRDIPHVTLIGEASSGILSDVLNVELGAGWQLGLSHQIYYDTEDNVFEHVGIPVDITAPASSVKGALAYGAFPAIEQAFLHFNQEMAVTEQMFDRAVDNIMANTGIPGLSIAWINDKEILDVKVQGFADIDTNRLVTPDTPFNLASISKTFIGVAAMQMVQQGHITLDSTLDDIAMPFTVESMQFDTGAISLKHLLTHTSGISDTDNYNCGYYLEEDNTPLVAAFGVKDDCPSPVKTGQSDFLASLLSANGELYSKESFLPAMGFHHYSNIGASLASELLSAASGSTYRQWTEENIFAPLNMNKTHWFNRDYQQDEALPAQRYLFTRDGSDIEASVLPEFALATWSDGGLKSSASDLARYLLAIARGGELDGQRILSDESIHIMLSPQIDQPLFEGHQGITWVNDDFLFGHDGGDPGTLTDMQFDQYRKMGFVILWNISDDLEQLDTDEQTVFNAAISELQHLVYRRGVTLAAEASN